MKNKNIKLTALSKEDLILLLKRSGSKKVSQELIEADIAAGLPVNNDGSINLLEYTAWLIRENNGI